MADNIVGESSNSGSEGNSRNYTVSIDKTMELVIMLVPEFHGELNEKLDSFLNACEIVVEVTPVANVDIMLRIILLKIKGHANEIVKFEQINSWVELKRLLKNTYDKPKNLAYLQMELCSAKQQNKESLIEYANRIRHLVQAISEESTQGNGNIRNNIREQALIVFLEGISDEIKTMVKSKNPTSLEQAIRIAIMEDKNITRSAVKSHNNNYNFCGNNSKKEGTQTFNKGNCHVCGKYGHYARDCWFKKGNVNGKKFANKPTERTCIVCAYCSKSGHSMDRCYKKKK